LHDLGILFQHQLFLGEGFGAFCIWTDAETIQKQHLWHTSGFQLLFTLKRLGQNNFVPKVMAELYS
jgi:hypothetical protein